MLFSNFGANKDSLGSTPEVISYDKEEGVFNYYVASGRGYEWHGDSIDAALSEGNRCANCHQNGSIVQKELDSPWINWSTSTTSPEPTTFTRTSATRRSASSRTATPSPVARSVSRADLERMSEEEIAALTEIPLMGGHGNLDGASVEGLVESAAKEYAKEGFVKHLLGEKGKHGMQVKELLEPLFCTQEIQLQTGGGDSGDVTFRADFFVAREFSEGSFNGGVSDLRGGGSVRVKGADYDKAIEDAGQFVGSLEDFGIRDTKRRLTYPERSFIDGAITGALLERGIVDSNLVSDILMVDFTRPVFSDARCALLTEADTKGAFSKMDKPEDVTADAIRAGLIRSARRERAGRGDPPGHRAGRQGRRRRAGAGSHGLCGRL